MKDPIDKNEKETGRLRKKLGLSNAQTGFLMTVYSVNQKPSIEERALIAKKLGVGCDKVRNWFQNKRAKDKRDSLKYRGLEHDTAEEPEPRPPIVYPDCNDLYRRRQFK